ncbi:MAG: 30S ribosomal protein S8 [Candidatus Bostrichicola ureolyticus]|nr:MAG: 30S ribosomal protein S8 [Candidatus Bostrichicola ureolyticus]
MNIDTIADYLTRIRNALHACHKIVKIPYSNIKNEITKILLDQGYILNFKCENDNFKKNIIIALKYHKNYPVIKYIKRISKPGLRKYCSSKKIPRVLNGLGIAIISTSKGLMICKKAKEKNIGGEILCYIY